MVIAGHALPDGVGRAASGAHGLTIRDAWLQERPTIMPMPTPFDGYVEVPARGSSTSLVSVARSRYSVPCAWAGHRVSVWSSQDSVDSASIRLFPEERCPSPTTRSLAESAPPVRSGSYHAPEASPLSPGNSKRLCRFV